MQPFVSHTGIAAPLRRTNVDTDQIINGKDLKGVTRSGYEHALFAEWRKDAGFVLNKPEFRHASILFAGLDFGVGSSREHAVWALMNYGFRAVVSPRFGDIFATNSGKQGLLTARCSEADVNRLMDVCEQSPGTVFAVDLIEQTIRSDGLNIPFEIDPYTRWRLLEGLDDIGLTLRDGPEIDRFERTRPSWLPVTSGL